MRRRTIDGDNWRDTNYWYDLDLDDPDALADEGVTVSYSLAMQYEGWYSVEDYMVNHYYAWFVAPATTRYRFYAVCDEHCAVKLGLTPGDSADPTVILDTHGATDKRWAWAVDSEVRISEWYDLEEGEQYYLEGEH